jgi:hypothetical protein
MADFWAEVRENFMVAKPETDRVSPVAFAGTAPPKRVARSAIKTPSVLNRFRFWFMRVSALIFQRSIVILGQLTQKPSERV